MKCKFCGTGVCSTIRENLVYRTHSAWCPNCGARYQHGFNKDAQRHYGDGWKLPFLGKKYFEMQEELLAANNNMPITEGD